MYPFEEVAVPLLSYRRGRKSRAFSQTFTRCFVDGNKAVRASQREETRGDTLGNTIVRPNPLCRIHSCLNQISVGTGSCVQVPQNVFAHLHIVPPTTRHDAVRCARSPEAAERSPWRSAQENPPLPRVEVLPARQSRDRPPNAYGRQIALVVSEHTPRLLRLPFLVYCPSGKHLFIFCPEVVNEVIPRPTGIQPLNFAGRIAALAPDTRSWAWLFGRFSFPVAFVGFEALDGVRFQRAP